MTFLYAVIYETSGYNAHEEARGPYLSRRRAERRARRMNAIGAGGPQNARVVPFVRVSHG